MAGKRKRLSVKEKIDIIDESEKSGLSTRKLAEKFKVGKTQVTVLLQNKEEIRNLYREGGNADQKRKFPKTEGLAVDQAVFNWFYKARNKHLPISGPMIQAKALEVAQSLGLSDFKASNGWLERFRRRHDIKINLRTAAMRTTATQKSESEPPLATSTVLLTETLKCSQPSTSSSSPSIDPFIKEEPSCSREEEPGFAPTLELLPEQTEQPHLGMATRSFKGNKDKMYCRLCLKPAYKNSLTPLSVVDFNYPGKNDAFKKKKLEKVEEINKMLKFCLPFFNSLTFNPIICSICLGRLKIAYEFSKECLKTQRLIEKYAETYGTTEKVINLNEMIETEFELFNDENISDTETNISGIPKPMRSSGRLREKRQYSKEDSPPAKKLKDYHETHEEDSLSSSNDDASNIKMEPDDEDSCALTDSVKMEPAEDNSSYMERLIQDIPKNYITDSNKIDEETIIKVEPNDIDCPDFIKIEPVDELHIESKVFNERTGIGIDIAEQHSEFQGVENVSLNTAKAPLNARGAVFPHVGSSLEDTTSDVIK